MKSTLFGALGVAFLIPSLTATAYADCLRQTPDLSPEARSHFELSARLPSELSEDPVFKRISKEDADVLAARGFGIFEASDIQSLAIEKGEIVHHVDEDGEGVICMAPHLVLTLKDGRKKYIGENPPESDRKMLEHFNKAIAGAKAEKLKIAIDLEVSILTEYDLFIVKP